MLRLPPFRYLAPRTVEQAAHMRAEERTGDAGRGRYRSVPQYERRPFTPAVLIGLRGIASLKSISGSPEQEMRIGAG